MNTPAHKIVEYAFFFLILISTAYLAWGLIAPFATTLALAAIVVSICYPLYERVYQQLPNARGTFAALIMLLFIIVLVVLPIGVLGSLLLREASSVYAIFNTSTQDTGIFMDSFEQIEMLVQQVVPNFSVDVAGVVRQGAEFISKHLVGIFAGTASTVFLTFIAMIATFYFFRDGKQLTQYLIQLSPLDNLKDSQILSRVAVAVRSVAVGTVSIAIIQGVLTAIGLALFGFDRAILWGCLAAIGALVPGIGTTIVFVPAIIYLFVTGATVSGFLLLLWGVLAVGLIDNLLGPYVMSRGNNIHPFLILISVLGGIASFGPIGFILGPVILSLFLSLLEIYHTHYEHR
jgi:predicted PurR-regulated permease PerM